MVKYNDYRGRPDLSPAEFWVWFDALIPADRKALNDARTQVEFRDRLHNIAARQVDELARKDPLTGAVARGLLDRSK